MEGGVGVAEVGAVGTERMALVVGTARGTEGVA